MTYIKLAGRSNHSFLQPFWWITFFKHICALNSVMECIIELNWLWKHIKKVRTSQPGILVLNCSSYIYIYIYIKRINQTDCSTGVTYVFRWESGVFRWCSEGFSVVLSLFRWCSVVPCFGVPGFIACPKSLICIFKHCSASIKKIEFRGKTGH